MKKLFKKSLSLLLVLATLISVISIMGTAAGAAINLSTYEKNVAAFLADSRWKHGTAWAARAPKLSTYSSSGCCAFCADFAAYVYGSKSKAWNTCDFTKYTNINDVRAGDIVQISGHWLVVLGRTGNDLYTAEGNFDDKVRVATNGWDIKNGKFYNVLAKSYNGFICGYHYNYAAMDMTFGFNANGGTGSMAGVTVKYNADVTVPKCSFTRYGYTAEGYYAKRNDGRWYVAGQGWFTDAEISAKGYTRKVYKIGETYTINKSWTDGQASCSFTLYPVWTPTGLGFVDVRTDAWYYDAVAYASQKGYVNGMSLEKYSPNTNITREQFVVIIANIAKVNTDGYKNTASGFTDVKTGKWYSGAIAWAVKKGYVSGVSATKFGLGQPLQRAALARMLYNFASKNGIDTSARVKLSAFGDAATFDKAGNEWMKELVQWAVANGIISGMSVNGVNCINPKGTATRAQAAQMLMKFDALVK